MLTELQTVNVTEFPSIFVIDEIFNLDYLTGQHTVDESDLMNSRQYTDIRLIFQSM